LLHLGVMLIVLTRLSPVTAAQPASAAPSRRALVGVAALGLYAAIVASHQLTPVMTLTAVTALLVVRRLTWPVLPFLMGALLAAWLIFVARDYLLAHPFWQSSFGGARDNVGKQLADLTVVSPERAFVASVARAYSALVWLLALIGAAWHLRTRRLNLAVAAVWAAPFPLLVVNSYGGELLFRIFLFTLPWSALLIAYAVTALPNQTRGARTVRTLTVATLSVVLTAALTLTYFGQERMNYVRQGDLSSSLFVNDAAPPEAAVMTLTSNFPLNVRSSHLNYYELSWVYSAEPGRTPADAVRDIVTFMRSREEPASYFIVSRGQLEQAALLGTMPREFAEQIKMLAARHPKLRVVFQDGDAVVFELVREEPREAR